MAARSPDETVSPPGDESGTQALGEFLVDDLMRRILTGDVPVGSWLRHNSVAEHYGVSRTPVREALRVLHAQGIVTIAPHRGARVNGHSARDVRELGAVRGELEGMAAHLAADRIDDAGLARLGSAWTAYEEAVAAAGPHADAAALWSTANEEFHSTIVTASGNEQLATTIADVSRRLPRNAAYAVYAGSSRLLRRNAEQHARIAEAITAGDADGARVAMRDHVVSSAEAMARWIEDGHGRSG